MTQPSSNTVSFGGASDSSGNVFVPMSFGGSVYVAIAKLNSTGQFQWLSTSLGDGTNSIYIGSITTDSSGNVYMTGAALSGNRT